MPQSVVVIGGGLSGLTACHRLHTRASADRSQNNIRYEFRLLESRDRLGGAIWTIERDGFLLEGGADSFITNKPWALDLCRELGIAGELQETDPQHRRSFVVHNKRLVPVPEGFILMAPARILPLLMSPILSFRGKLRLLLDLVRPRRVDDTEESLAAFVRRRLGREALDRLVQPLIAGIYTADPNELSLRSTLPQFIQMEQEHGSLIRAARKQARKSRQADRAASGARYGLFVSPRRGMGRLIEALASSIPPGTLRTDAPVRRMTRHEPSGRWRIELLDGSFLEANAVVLATEAHAAARLLESQDPELALQLRAVPYASSIVANLAYRRDAVAHPLDGFGAVVPAVENRSILAVSFTSVKFAHRAPQGTVLLRVFLGGALQPELIDLDDERIEQIIRSELADLIGAHGQPLFCELSRHTRAMPQYTLGHADRVAAIRASIRAHEGLFITGNAFDGVGVPDCIRAARETADHVVDYLARKARSAAA